MEMVAEAKVLIVNQACDKCGEGIMECYEKSAQSPNAFTHKCNKCGFMRIYNARYPYQRIVPIEVLREPVGREIAE